MAIQESTPPASTGPGSETSEPENDLTLEKKLAILQEKFAALEQKFSHLHEKGTITTENAIGEVTDSTVSSGTTDEATDDSTPGEKETGPKSRAKIVINRIDPATGERKDQLPSETNTEVSKEQDKSHAFLLRKNVDLNNRDDNDGELEIISPDLWDLLKKLLSNYPYHYFQGDPVTFNSPYEPFILHWDKLEKAAKEGPGDEKENQARLDLRLLLDTIASGSGDLKLDKYFKARESNIQQRCVTFESLWTLFPPGTLVYGKPFQGQDQIFIVKDNIGPWPPVGRKTIIWTLECWTYDWNGKSFKRMGLRLEVESFDGTKPITELPFYPLDYHQQPEDLKKRLVERGAKYKKVCTLKQGSRMFDYKGDAVFGKKGFSGLTGDDDEDDDNTTSSYDQDLESSSEAASISTTSVDGRVMVDFESWFRYGPAVAKVGPLVPNVDNQCGCLECQNDLTKKTMYRTQFDEDACQEDWVEEQYLLCPPRVLGYVLGDKQWAQLRVTSLEDIPKENPDHSWDRVKLADGEETKEMILALVNGHGTADSKDDDSGLVVDDIVAKKGKGLVILLYGPPGVGKTSTAETVAIAARKPLFSISVADVGTKAKKVEANLAKLFALATSWQAILLIDEADVFLESRGKGAANSTERNALVSVFLRVLEYYQGILMLTTNQIAHFDVAVQSRIHIAIKYGKLSQTQTMAIFEGFLKPLAEKSRVKDMDDIRDWIKEDVCKLGLDGRQIRNVVTSALGIARAKGKRKLDKKDLKQILNNVRDYKDDFVRQFEKYKNSQDGMIS